MPKYLCYKLISYKYSLTHIPRKYKTFVFQLFSSDVKKNTGLEYILHTSKKSNISVSKSTLRTSLKHLIQNCYFMVGNSQLRQKLGIQMGIDPAPF